jgi:6-phosphogluconolactonase (cycloisomerase 2 family)
MLEWIRGSQRLYKIQVLVMFSVLPFLGGNWSMGSTGELTQLNGQSGCISNTGTSGACVPGNGLDGAGWVEISNDGKYVYVASFTSSTITTFSRNPNTGVLTQLPGIQGCIGDTGDGVTCAHGNGLSGAVSLALSPDGNQLYAVSRSNSLAIFSRDASTGVLTQPAGTAGCLADPGDGITCTQAHALGGPRSVTVSPDGRTVYVGARDGSAVAVFSRNLTTGALTQLAGLAGCVSNDGTGGLCAQGVGLVGARGVKVSPDNQSVYVASQGDGINSNGALLVFSRDPSTGTLTQLSGTAGCSAPDGDGHTCALARGLVTPISLDVSADGRTVYVASRDSSSIAVFLRMPNGALTQLSGSAGCVEQIPVSDPTCASGQGLNQPVFVSVSPDGYNVYAAAQESNAVTIFSRNPISGVLTQLGGLAGCISSDGTGGSCAVGTALGGALSINTSLDGKNVYATADIDGSVLVFNRTPGGDSNTLPPTVVNPVPTVTSLSPATVSAGGPAFTIIVNGRDFVSTSTVQLNNIPRNTTFLSSSQLQASILSSDITQPGTAQITVFSPGGGISNAVTFTISAPGTLVSYSSDNKAALHVFPEFVDGRFSDGSFYTSTIMISSDNTTATNCTVTLSGLTVPGFGNGSTQTLNIGAGGWTILTTPGTQSVHAGYATLACGAPVAAQVLFSSLSASGIVSAEATVFSSPSVPMAQLLADGRNGARLGMAIANTSTGTSSYLVQAFDATNQQVGSATVEIPGQGQIAKFVDELITVPNNFVGTVVISPAGGTGEVYAIGLSYHGGVFTTIPVTARTFR